MKALGKHLPQKLRMTSSGFTLIELMVTIAVLAIIVGIAAPSISNQLANQRVKSSTSLLLNALKEAKVEGVIRRQEVKLSYDNNGNNVGEIELEDDSSDTFATYRYDAKSTIKSVDDDGDDDNEIKFKPNKTADEMTFTICDSNTSASPRQVTVSAIGIITSQLGGTCP